MGNARSRHPSRSLCLLYLIRRSWKMVQSAAGGRGPKPDERHEDCATELSTASRCSGCKGCGYHPELNFDSESDMAPNAEEDLLVTMARGGPNAAKERLRPPTYNAEDYAIALRRWGRRALGGQPEAGAQGGTLPSTCTSSSSGYASANGGEMTLRQFTSVSELLNKLRADLRLAFPSFVQEFASAPAEGISLLLETLRGIQLSQSTPPSGQTGGRRPRARRAALDELGCVECLVACAERCPEAARLLAQAQPGLLALAVCLTSSLNRSRVLALQLLTRVCGTTGGHAAVSEAVSTLRLRFGEGGRFRFLAGALLATKAAPALRLAGVSFLNAFLSSAPRAQTKLYIQAEACEAGLEPRTLQEWLKFPDDEDPATELLREEVSKWSRHCVDVDALQGRARRAEETCRLLSKKVSALQHQLQKIQLERLNEYNSARSKQQQQGPSHASDPLHHPERNQELTKARAEVEKKMSSGAEDEGISFSERSSSPEEGVERQATAHADNDQETTIEDVIEELRIIVKDAEEELQDWSHLRDAPGKKRTETARAAPSKARESLRSSEETARIDRGLKILVPAATPAPPEEEDEDGESAIVPAIIHPQPPRRAPACPLFLAGAAADPEDEELLLLEDDGSDSLLSASRLNYQQALKVAGTSEGLEGGSRGRQAAQSNSRCSTAVQRRTERRKYLRRCQSQEQIEPQDSCSVRSRGSGVLEHIRKFESLTGLGSLEGPAGPRLRRSESFHQTRLSSRGSSSRGGGSDLGGPAARAPRLADEQQRSMSKSLDRIDEGLDAAAAGRSGRCRLPALDDDRKYTSFLEVRRDSAEYTERCLARQLPADPRVFAGRPHDVLGFGRNRFNAGKYSGVGLAASIPAAAAAPPYLQRPGLRHSAPPHHLLGKLTDMVSGLY